MTIGEDRRAEFNRRFSEAMLAKGAAFTKTPSYKDKDMAQAINALVATEMKRSSSSNTSSDTIAPNTTTSAKEVTKGSGGDNSIWESVVGGLGHALDVVARPAYAVAEGMRNAQQHINQGDNPFSIADDAIWGAGQGLGGYRKTGFGDVVEEATKYDSTGKSGLNRWAAGNFGPIPSGGQILNNMEHTNPELAKRVKQGLGFVGDIATDPLSYLSAPSKYVSKASLLKEGKAGLRAGAVKVGKDAVKTDIDNAVRTGLKDTVIDTLPDYKVRVKSPVTKMYVGSKSINPTQAVLDAADDIVERTVYEIHKGAQVGKVIGTETIRETVSKQVGESFREQMIRRTQKSIDTFYKGISGNGAKMSQKTASGLAKTDNLFKTYYDNFTDLVNKGTTDTLAHKQAIEAMAKSLDDEVSKLATAVAGELENHLLKIPTLRFMGQEIARFPNMGRVMQKTGLKWADSSVKKGLKAFSFSSNFPGYTTLIAQKARSLGLINYEAFRRKVATLAEGVSKKERAILQDALEKGTVLSGHLEAKRLELRALYDEIFNNEIKAGVRRVTNRKDPNYVFTHLRVSVDSRKQFLKMRKNELENGLPLTHDLAKAAEMGLKPNKDAFENLLYRQVKSNQKLTKHFFEQDLVTHYGIKGILSESEATRRGLAAVDQAVLPESLKKSLKPGEKIFLDKDIVSVRDYYRKLAEWSDREAEVVLKQIEYVVRKFKVWNTIYFPSFHMRNFLGDMYFGAMDGVTVKDYGRVMKNWLHKDTADIVIGGETKAYRDVWDAFERNATGGTFLSTDLENTALRQTKGALGAVRHPTTFPSAVRSFSEHREDLGRFAHFYHAMNEEYPALLRKGYSKKKAWDDAINAAVYRVNKYKFDYGALTKTENTIKRFGVPFYTYTRKAIPTLLESALLSPRNLSYTSKWMNALSPEGNDRFGEGLMIPEWMQDQGFAAIWGGEEPTGLSGNIFPQNSLTDAVNNPQAMLSPVIRAPFELKFGKSTFSGEKINNPYDVLATNFRLFKTIEKQLDPSVSGAEKAGNLTGIPLFTLSKKRQEQAAQSAIWNMKSKIRPINDKLHKTGLHIMYSITKAGNMSVKISRWDEENQRAGDTLGVYPSYEEAMKALKSTG